MKSASPILVKPSAEHERAFCELLGELEATEEQAMTFGCLWSTRNKFLSADRDFQQFLLRLRDKEKSDGLPPGIVPMSTYWLMHDARIVGESHLRHQLTPALEIEGGHIGYSIRPSERRQGYGTRILALTLDQARALSLPRVLVTCDVDNIGSAKIIQKNGGLYHGTGISPRTGKQVAQYWIDL